MHPLKLWRNRDFLLLCSGQAISSIGSQVSQLALPLLILAITKSPAQAGLLASLRALPYVFFSLPAGALIDRWNRKRVMILCDTGRALSMASIPFALAINQLTLAQLYLVSLIEGTLFLLFSLAEAACLPRLVTKEQLPAATMQNEIATGASFFLGPPLGGALYSLGRVFPFLADAVSYSISVLSLLWIRAEFQEERIAGKSRLRTDIAEGLSWLRHEPVIRFIAFLSCGYNLTTSGYLLLFIILAQHRGASSFDIGLLLAIASLGGLLGALTASPLQKRLGLGPMIIGMAWLWVVIWPLYAFASNLVILSIITTAVFIIAPMYDIVQFSYRLASTPDELQGRVNSVFRLGLYGGQSLGLALTGVLLQMVGPVSTVLFSSAGLLIIALAATLHPLMRNMHS